jgi:hypothetical protein
MTVLKAAVAASIYIALAVVFFGGNILSDPRHYYIGSGQDPAAYLWCLVWWPFALAHKINPFVSQFIWVPNGANLEWSPSIPGPSLLLSPVTRYAGPVFSYNVLMLVAPASAATAAFLVCSRISRDFLPSFVGGYLFGFSSYALGQELSHLSLALVACIPLAVYLVLLRIESRISLKVFLPLYAIALISQFLIATETFATLCEFTAMALFFAIILLPACRKVLSRTSIEIALAYGICAFVVSPFLYYVFKAGEPGPSNSPELCSADLLSFIIPTQVTYLGSGLLKPIADRLNPQLWFSERGGYLGLALLVISFHCWRHRREPLVRVATLLIVAIVICSLGPRLHIGGNAFFTLPWAFMLRLPFIDQALPIRFSLYIWLLVAMLTTRALSVDIRSRWLQLGAALAIIVSVAPNIPYFRTQVTKVDTPAWITTGQFKQVVPPNAILLILPYGHFGNSMLWQAESGMSFRMIGGYISSFTPSEYLRWPSLRQLDLENPTHPGPDVLEFLRTHQVYGIVVAKQLPAWRDALGNLGIEPKESGDVLFYRLPAIEARSPRA